MNPAALIAGLAKRGLSPKQITQFLNKVPQLINKGKLAIPTKGAKGALNQVDDLIAKVGIKPAKSATKLTKDQIKKLEAHKALNQQPARTDVRSGRTSQRPTKKAPTGQWLDGMRWGQVEDLAVRTTQKGLEASGIDPDSAKGQIAQGAATAASAGLGIVQAARGRGSTGLSTNKGLSRAQAARRAARGETQSARGGQTPNPRKNNPDRVARQSQQRAERKAKGTNKRSGRAEFIVGQRVAKSAQGDVVERVAVDPVKDGVAQQAPKQTIDQRVDNSLQIRQEDNAGMRVAKGLGQGLVLLGEATGIPTAVRQQQDRQRQYEQNKLSYESRKRDDAREFGRAGKIDGTDEDVVWAGSEWGWLDKDSFAMVDDVFKATGQMPVGGTNKQTSPHWQPIGFEGVGQALQTRPNRGRSGAKRAQQQQQKPQSLNIPKKAS